MFLTTNKAITHISNNLDLLVLHFVEDICIAERLQERRPCFALIAVELDKLLQLCTPFLKVPGKLLSSCLIWEKQRMLARVSEQKIKSETHLFCMLHLQETPFSFLRVSVLQMSILMAASCFSLKSTSSMDRLYLDSSSISAWG